METIHLFSLCFSCALAMTALAAQTHFLQYAIQSSSLALLYYDYILTFPSEIRYIWRIPTTWPWQGSLRNSLSTALYFFCRYSLLANVLFFLAISGALGGGGACDATYKVIGVVSVLGRAAVISTFLLRTWVVCARNIAVLIVLGTLALAIFILDCIHVPGLRCHGSSTIQIANTLLSIFVCIFEGLATLLTLMRTAQAAFMRKRKPGQMLEALLAEQSVLYFALISGFTVGATVLNFRAPGGFFQRLLNAFTLPLSGLLTARFLLLLRAQRPSKPSARLGHEEQGEGGASVSVREEVSEVAVAVAATGLSSVWDEFGEDPVSPVSRHGTGDVEEGIRSPVEDVQRVELETISEEDHSRDRSFPEFVVGSSGFRASQDT